MTPDEVRNLPEDLQLLFLASQRPIMAAKLAYYRDPESKGPSMAVDAIAKQDKREPGHGGDRGPKPALSRARTASKSLSPGFLALARNLDALLVQPIAVLPQKPGDLIRPFKLGVRPQIEALRRPDVSEAKLAAALRRYAKSVAYQSALARHGSMRHDIDGTPVELVSDEDRQSAAQDLQARREKWARERAAAVE